MVDDDAVEETSSQFDDARLLPELLFPDCLRVLLNLGPTASPPFVPDWETWPPIPMPGP